MQVSSADGEAITHSASVSGAANGGMALLCDWDPHHAGTILASSSNGSITQSSISESTAQVVSSWKAHDMEAWVVACDTHMVRSHCPFWSDLHPEIKCEVTLFH